MINNLPRQNPYGTLNSLPPVSVQSGPGHIAGVLLRTFSHPSRPFNAAPDRFPFPSALVVLARENWPVPRGVGNRGGLYIRIELRWLEDEDHFQIFWRKHEEEFVS